MPLAWLSLAAFAVLVLLLPWLFAELMAGALAKLHVSPGAAAALIIAILLGSLVNIPVRRIARGDERIAWTMRRDTVVAVNLGGCAPENAAPVAYIAGVAGPLVGADLLHLKDIAGLETGIASIGGAGTFDGILLSGIVAAYLS